MIQTKVFNMESSKGNKVANQFLITTDEAFYFQSYNSIIAKRTNEGKILLDEKFWDYSTTTGKYRNQFLNDYGPWVRQLFPNDPQLEEFAQKIARSETLQIRYIKIAKMEREAAIKKELMQYEFEINKQLQEAQLAVIKEKDKFKEDRKDERTKIQASQQSELIDQRKNNAPPKSFESAGQDNLGGFGLEQFEPR